jgi:hypothetical protein
MTSLETDNVASEEKPNPDGLKVYTKPAILHDLTLETRAGSPFSVFPDPLDPTGAGE